MAIYEKEVDSYYQEILNEVNEISNARMIAISSNTIDDLSLCVPNVPDMEVTSEELESIEYLNSVRDVKLRVEANVLKLELQLKRQQLSAVQSAISKSESVRVLSNRMKDLFFLADSISTKQESLIDMESRQAGISARLSDCEARLERFQSSTIGLHEDLKVTEEIMRVVKISIERLTHQMELAGHSTLDSLTSAIETVRLEAGRAEAELDELRSQADAMAAQLNHNVRWLSYIEN